MKRLSMQVCRIILALTIAFFAGIVCTSGALASVQDFTFIQISDEHANSGPSTAATIADLSALSSVNLEPYGITALPPSFVIETGDITEFGPKNGAWDLLNKWYADCKLPRYMALGNHDGTWRSLTPEMTKLYGAPYYSFDKFGCHFVILDSAGLQDPRPVLSPEELEWLKIDLKKAGPNTPVFLALHHPLDCPEYSSGYEVDRLTDILHQSNIALILSGHGHSDRYVNYDGFDMIEGGSGFGPGKPGYQVISVLDGKMRVAFKIAGSPSATNPMIEKSLAAPVNRYPSISILSPEERSSFKNNMPVIVKTNLSSDQIKNIYAEIDGGQKIDLVKNSKGNYINSIDASKLSPGAHYIRICAEEQNSIIYKKSACFYAEPQEQRVLWRKYIGAANKNTPAVFGDTLFIGTNDGFLHALDIRSSEIKWAFKTKGAVACEPLVLNNNVCFGSEDGNLYSCSIETGEMKWSFNVDEPIYSSPVTDGKSIYFGSSSGAFYSINASSGKLNWKNTNATYNIEMKPLIFKDKIYFGCWDSYLYSLNTSDGSLAWKCMGQGSSEGTIPAYYSPADCTPVVCGGKIYAPDRKYRLSIIDESTGVIDKYIDGVSAVGLSADSNYVYLRKTNGDLAKIDSNGNNIWSASVSMDIVPASPVESGSAVYVCSKSGLVSAVSSVDGKILWQYRATPLSFVLSSAAASENGVFIAGTDGVVTAFKK